jgi:Protein of unknown function (DUF4089)
MSRKPAPKRKVARAKRKSRRKADKPRHDVFDALVTAGAQVLGLALDPAWHAGVGFNLQLILRHAALVEGFPLPDDAEPAPVFHA